MSEEIIEHEGRRFVRTGETRPTEKGEFFWWPMMKCVRKAEGRGIFDREILREMPVESVLLAEAESQLTTLATEAQEVVDDLKYNGKWDISKLSAELEKAEAVLARIRAARGEKS